MKFENAGPNQTVVIDWTRLYRTDGLTDMCKAIYPLFFEGEHYKVLPCMKIGLIRNECIWRPKLNDQIRSLSHYQTTKFETSPI